MNLNDMFRKLFAKSEKECDIKEVIEELEPKKHVPIKAYKMMHNDMTCRGFKYELGKTYELNNRRELELCNYGFHACLNPIDCLLHYNNISGNKRMFIVEMLGDIDAQGEPISYVDDTKIATNKIHIVEEFTIDDIYKYIEDNRDDLSGKHWALISSCLKLTEEFIVNNVQYLCAESIVQYQKSISEEGIAIILENAYKINPCVKQYKLFDIICTKYNLSEEFIDRFKENIDWSTLFVSREFSEEFIRKYVDYYDYAAWLFVHSACKDLSSEFKKEFKDKLDKAYYSYVK